MMNPQVSVGTCSNGLPEEKVVVLESANAMSSQDFPDVTILGNVSVEIDGKNAGTTLTIESEKVRELRLSKAEGMWHVSLETVESNSSVRTEMIGCRQGRSEDSTTFPYQSFSPNFSFRETRKDRESQNFWNFLSGDDIPKIGYHCKDPVFKELSCNSCPKKCFHKGAMIKHIRADHDPEFGY